MTWLGARFALAGRSTPARWSRFYGYAAFLVIPLRTSAEAVDKITRALVGARRMLTVLEVERDIAGARARPRRAAAGRRRLVDHALGARRRSRARSPCLVSALPDDTAAIADRLGRFGDDGRRHLGGVPLADLRAGRSSAAGSSSARPTRCSSPARCAHELDPWGRATATTTRSSPRSPSRTPRTSSTRCPRGSTRPSTSAGARSRAASASGSCWRARSSRTPRCSCSSSRRAPSTRTPRRGSPTACARRAPAGRPSSSPPSPLVLDRADRVVFVARGPRRRRGHAPRAPAAHDPTTARS